jgi:hypothetical protein
MLRQPQGHSAAGRIMSMKNSSEVIGNRTRDLPACSAVPRATAPPTTCIYNQPWPDSTDIAVRYTLSMYGTKCRMQTVGNFCEQ